MALWTDAELDAATFASTLLKHSTCSPLDFVLNDKAACAHAFQHTAALSIATPRHADTYFLPEDLSKLKEAARVCDL